MLGVPSQLGLHTILHIYVQLILIMTDIEYVGGPLVAWTSHDIATANTNIAGSRTKRGTLI